MKKILDFCKILEIHEKNVNLQKNIVLIKIVLSKKNADRLSNN